jgi:hypothetical protein
MLSCGKRLLGGVGGGLEGVSDEHDGFPLVEEDGVEPLIEFDGRRIPVQHFPTHAEIVFVPGDPRYVREQSLAKALLSKLRPDVDIFEKQSGASLEGRVELEENGIAGRFAIQLGDDGAKFGLRTEAVAGDGFGGHAGFVSHVLILGELKDHGTEQRGVFDCGRADGKHMREVQIGKEPVKTMGALRESALRISPMR